MSTAIFRDPIEDGAADPTVIRREGSNEWWMFYTNRRPSTPGPKFTWIHGCPIGVAVSVDDGASWSYRGTVAGLDAPGDVPGGNTHWAPEVIYALGQYHMFLSYISGIPSDWPGVPRTIVHYTSPDLSTWTRVGPLTLSSPRVIDAAVAPCPDGLWRLWYKDENNHSATWAATSPNLMDWTVEGEVIPGDKGGRGHEGPNVFVLGGWHWMIVDEWRGKGVYRSSDARNWQWQGLIGDVPGLAGDDKRLARHADVVVVGEHAVLYYFTHPEWNEHSQAEGPPDIAARRTAIHHGKLRVVDGVLVLERNVAGNAPLLRA
ncbi:family 43 glycosylhydrolase [Devosia sp. FKR38]|uniref:family 43 glycosylhydrolase n=1 Tax=Devosia sp. FKR38 TaxID=2562312 RepID=UPI0010BFA64A|nr:family 43 glycosylhydrolase [Devosia sp. FKR38]